MLTFKCPENRSFFEYWQSLPREGLIPSRLDFLPEEIPNLLPYVSIFELISEKLIKFRLAGTEVSRNAGFERTGTNYLDQIKPERRQKASEAFWAVYNQPCATRVLLEYVPRSGIKKMIEGVGLPVLNDPAGYPLLYYCTVEYTEEQKPSVQIPNDQLELVSVKQRDFIDIGAGVSDFKD